MATETTDFVYVPFKAAVGKKRGYNILFKHRHRAGIKAELFIKFIGKPVGKKHISYSHGRRNSF